MALTINAIKELIEKQKAEWLKASLSDYDSPEEMRKAIEADFLQDNDIVDRAKEFAGDVDEAEVGAIRSDAMQDVLIALKIA